MSSLRTAIGATGALALAFGAGLRVAASQAPSASSAAEAMPAAQQNALVGKYCATCHDNKKRLGGLTLETFDAARPDPAIAGMMVNKLDGGAMGAAGLAQPDKAVVAALRSALAAAARNTEAATGGWTLKAFNDPTSKVPLVTASTRQGGYELTVTCAKISDYAKSALASHPAQMQVTGPAANGSLAQLAYDVDGAAGQNPIQQLPSRSLTLRGLPSGESVTFGFDRLTPTVREVLSTCLDTGAAPLTASR